ncbi:TetR/AcrR family transcriptional regulator [Flavisphingomonas formosensis]|uniref:TetR/AcrR family transcriptional regulator n=1 Tax=Flavisphingomonas formosensis TaxID=861534 RepID=UPI0012FA49E2|nr:TetR/AcrR family transcriptional regulator [Sphingomonas formosensis]
MLICGDRRRVDRREAILEAAEALFLEHGYDRVSLGAIVKRSGGSLATLYELFENKQGLLRAVVGSAVEERDDAIEAMIADGHRPSEVLRAIARNLTASLSAPRMIGLMRIVMIEGLRDPEFARRFYSEYSHVWTLHLAALLQQWNDAGLAVIDDSEGAADLYFSLLLHDVQMRGLFRTSDDEPSDGRDPSWRIEPFITHYRVQ